MLLQVSLTTPSVATPAGGKKRMGWTEEHRANFNSSIASREKPSSLNNESQKAAHYAHKKQRRLNEKAVVVDHERVSYLNFTLPQHLKSIGISPIQVSQYPTMPTLDYNKPENIHDTTSHYETPVIIPKDYSQISQKCSGYYPQAYTSISTPMIQKNIRKDQLFIESDEFQHQQPELPNITHPQSKELAERLRLAIGNVLVEDANKGIFYEKDVFAEAIRDTFTGSFAGKEMLDAQYSKGVRETYLQLKETFCAAKYVHDMDWHGGSLDLVQRHANFEQNKRGA